MSLTTDIANLVARADALITIFESKKTAIAAVPSLTRTLYVDAVLGNDTSSGEAGAPLQTIARAVALTPTGGFGTIRLLSDIHVAADITIDAKEITLISYPDGTKRRLTFERYVYSDDGSPTRGVRAFVMSRCGKLALRNLAVEVPDSSGYESAAIGSQSVMIRHGGASGAYFTTVKVSYCEVDFPAAPFGALLDTIGPFSLFWYANTMVDQGPTGRLFRTQTDTATGTSVASLPWLISNLTTI